MDTPEEWTDDMSIALPDGYNHEDVANVVLDSIERGETYEVTHDLLIAVGISCDDAYLAYDRVQGGLVRAGSWSRRNMPDPEKDPIAYAAFQRARRHRSLIRRFRGTR